MNKEYIEALKMIKIKCHPNSNPSPLVDEALNIIEKALQRLEAIENAKYSEALEKFDYIENDIKFAYDDDYVSYDYTDDVEYIKHVLLKAQTNDEILQKYYQEGITLDSVRALKQERDKYKQALSIIKEKSVSIFQLSCCKNVNEYNDLKFKDSEKLTQEEFDLLKEVFKIC